MSLQTKSSKQAQTLRLAWRGLNHFCPPVWLEMRRWEERWMSESAASEAASKYLPTAATGAPEGTSDDRAERVTADC